MHQQQQQHQQHQRLAGMPVAYSGAPPQMAAAYAPPQQHPQNYGYPPPHQLQQAMGYYQAAPGHPAHHGFYAAAPHQQQAVYYQQQAHQPPHMPHPHQQPQHPHQSPIHIGPPPSYGGGPQYPTGYCPPPAYQAPISVQHIQPIYNHAGPIQVKCEHVNKLRKSILIQIYQILQKGIYDSGARFNGKGGGTMSIPPPPPGYAPNAAQMAAMKGQPVSEAISFVLQYTNQCDFIAISCLYSIEPMNHNYASNSCAILSV